MAPKRQTNAQPRTKWWRRDPRFTIDQGEAVARPGSEVGFEIFWKPFDQIAGLYEAVRHIEKLDDLVEEPTRIIPWKQRQFIRTLRPFDKLSFDETNALRIAYDRHTKKRPVATRTGYYGAMFGGYSRPIPPWRFDLYASEKAIKAFVLSWIQSEKEFARINRLGPGGHKARNADQSYMPFRWDHLELIEGSSKAPKRDLERLLEKALESLGWVEHGIMIGRAQKAGAKLVLPKPLTGPAGGKISVKSIEQLTAALKAVAAKKKPG